MVSKPVSATASTSKRHYTQYYIITWPCTLLVRQGRNVNGQGEALKSLSKNSKPKRDIFTALYTMYAGDPYVLTENKIR